MPMSSINRVVLVGNLTRDPELRPLDSGGTVCHLRVACNSRRRTKEGAWTDRANYFDVSVFGPHGENAHRYLRKGRSVAIDGRLEWREWEGADEHKRQAVGIVAETVQFLGKPEPPRPAEQEAGGAEGSAGSGGVGDGGAGAGAAPEGAAGASNGGEAAGAAGEDPETVGDPTRFAGSEPLESHGSGGDLEPVGALSGDDDVDDLTF